MSSTNNDGKNFSKVNEEIIPSELRITLVTSVPGYQQIEYSPNMSVPNISKSDDKVYFNPLVKLNPSIIQQVPTEIRTTEFFNKGLFRSLMNFHGNQTVTNLKDAITYGYVDSNIKTTIDTLFPTNSVIRISGQPYVIVDAMWTKGDWRLGSKPINIGSLARDKYVSSIIKDELISGQKFMANVPDDIKYGPNYVGPPDVIPDTGTAAGVSEAKEAKETKETNQQQEKPLQIEANKETPTDIEPYRGATQTAPPAKPLPPSSQVPNPPPPPPPKQDVEFIGEKRGVSPANPATDTILQPANGANTSTLRGYFGYNSSIFKLQDIVYKAMTLNQKKGFNQYLKLTTITNVKEISKGISQIAYTRLVNGLNVISNRGGGDCMFLAIADGINNYNKTKPENQRITYGTVGNDTIFTQGDLRRIVSNRVIRNKKEYVDSAAQSIGILNAVFADLVKANPNPANVEYMSLIDKVYRENINFLVKKPLVAPANKDEPFTEIISDNDEIRAFIMSPNYWGDERAIDVFCKELNLNIITLMGKNKIITEQQEQEQEQEEESMEELGEPEDTESPPVKNRRSLRNIPAKRSQPPTKNQLISKKTAQLGGKQGIEITLPSAIYCNPIPIKPNPRYLFLYNYGFQHYELITFDRPLLYGKISGPPVSIFENYERKRESQPIIPPVYIIFFLYGAYYFRLSTKEEDSEPLKRHTATLQALLEEKKGKSVVDNDLETKIKDEEREIEIQKKQEPSITREVYASGCVFRSLLVLVDNVVNEIMTKQDKKYKKLQDDFRRYFNETFPNSSGKFNTMYPQLTQKGGVDYPLYSQNPYSQPYYNSQNPYSQQPYYNPQNPYPQNMYSQQPYYQPYYNSQQPNQYYNPPNMIVQDPIDKSKTSIYITVYLELEIGTSLTSEQQRGVVCRKKGNAVVQAFDDMLGRKYLPKPVYYNYPKLNKTAKTQPKQVSNQSTRKMYKR